MNITVRITRFAVVGTLCYLVQLGLMHAIHHIMNVYCADVIAASTLGTVEFCSEPGFHVG